jgi:hypothetical protein
MPSRSTASADGERADDHSLDHRMRVAFEHRPIHERARVPLVRVADDIAFVRRCVATRLPLLAGRKTAAAATAEVRLLHFVEHALRAHFQGLGQRVVAALGDVIVDDRRIDVSVLSENEPLLVLVKRNVLLELEFLFRYRRLVIVFLQILAAQNSLLHYFSHVLGLDPLIQNAVRMKEHQCSALAEPVASGGPERHVRYALFLEFLAKCGHHVLRAVGVAARARAHRHDFHILGAIFEKRLAIS